MASFRNIHPYTLIMFALAFATAFAVAFPLFVGMAHAQSIDNILPDRTVDFTPLVDQVATFAILALTALAAVLSKFVARYVASLTGVKNAEMEALFAAQVHGILLKSIDYAEQWYKEQVANPGTQFKEVRIDNFFLAEAVKYAMRSMPELVSYFGLTEDRIRTMILSRLNALTITGPADSGQPTQLASELLAPA